MDAGKVFVVILTLFAVSILVYLEMKSRRSAQQAKNSLPLVDEESTTETREGQARSRGL